MGKHVTLVPFLILFVTLFLSLPAHCVHSQCNRNPVIFNFGDSNSDTGGISAGLGYYFGLPDGRAFFHQSTGRLSDGRVVIDFLSESLNAGLLTPYLESLAPNFTNGANFAIGGSATLPRNTPFNLAIQVNQFIRFQNHSLQLVSKGVKGLVGDEDFKNALYMIDIGQNDLSAAFTYLSLQGVVEKSPSFISEIKDAIIRIYGKGGKNFWVHNTGPLGCLPQKLATISKYNASDFDQYGCILSLNEGAKVFNQKLKALCEELRSELKNSIIVYVDIYTAKYELFVNSATYGFEKPLMVCCGYGGPPYNFNPNITCLQSGYNVCDEGSPYISWDGVHYTDAANSIVAFKILSTNYSTPQIKLDYFCSII